jgi:hypothetical protein
MTRVAQADHGQICAAAQAGRLLVPTRSLPDKFDIPHPFAPAPRDRIGVLFAAYEEAGTCSAHAVAAVAMVAENIRAPSQILTAVRAAAQGGNDFKPNNMQQPAKPAAEPSDKRGFPGPVERILLDLGVTSPVVLARATTLDQLSEQLVLDATAAIEPQQAGMEAIGLSRSTGPAELINQMLASGSPRVAAILRPPFPSAPPPEGQEPCSSPANRRCISPQNGCPAPEPEAEP